MVIISVLFSTKFFKFYLWSYGHNFGSRFDQVLWQDQTSLQKKNLGSTEFPHQIALPHPLNSAIPYHDISAIPLTVTLLLLTIGCRTGSSWPCSALTYLLSAKHGKTPLSFFLTDSWPFATLILCIWLDRTMIQPYAKYQWRRTAGCQLFCHFVRPNYLGAHKVMQHRFVFPNGFLVDLDSGTLHAVVSYHDPRTHKVSSENIGWLLTFWPLGALASTCERPKWPNVVYIFFKSFLDDSK
jgi:hypothetical protein